MEEKIEELFRDTILVMDRLVLNDRMAIEEYYVVEKIIND
jgi:hypothetical protein